MSPASLVRSVVGLLAAALLLAGCTGSSGGGAGRPGTDALPAPLPSLELEPFGEGEPLQLAEQRGPLVINLWASWCSPCRREMPILEQFARKHAGRVDVIGIDYQDPQTDAARELVADTGVTYPLFTDLDGELDRLGPFPHLRGLPFWAFVDADGEVVAWEFVEVEQLAELEQLVETHLGVT